MTLIHNMNEFYSIKIQTQNILGFVEINKDQPNENRQRPFIQNLQ